jgi:SET domain-containing protein
MTMHSAESSSLTFIIEQKRGSAIEVKEIKNKGRGVIARKKFEQGDIIERAPVILLGSHEEPLEDETLYHYTFAWGEGSAVALGYGSIYNHSYTPNAYYVRDEKNKCINFVALREIEEGEEITLNYNGTPHSTAPLWFPVH